jgi:hypothetical protein
MKRVLSTVVLTITALVALTACGNGTDPGTATESPASTSPTPTARPTVGTYPAFEPADYTYTLAVTCFCADGGVPIRVTVENGAVTDAVYAKSRNGVKAGDPVEPYRRLTINDVIDAANDTEADRVDVVWPAGQDYPTSVYVDPQKNAMDEEVGYEISDVNVA